MGLLQKLSQSKGASICIIIKLANIHAMTQYLYEGNWKGDKSPEAMQCMDPYFE